MMFLNKKTEKDYSQKKYLAVIVVIMLLAAIFLALSNYSKGDKGKNGEIDQPVNKQSDNLNEQSYKSSNSPQLEDGDKIVGSKKAELKIFVYEDYDDIYSARLDQTIKKLINDYDGKLAFVFRPYIGSSLKSKESAILLECVKDSKWEETRNYLFRNLISLYDKEVDLKESIADNEISNDEMASCLTNNEKSEKIEQLISEAKKYNVQGSPTIFVGDEIVLGARPYDDYIDSNGDNIAGLKSIVDGILAKK